MEYLNGDEMGIYKLKKWRKRLGLPEEYTDEELVFHKKLEEGISFEELIKIYKRKLNDGA